MRLSTGAFARAERFVRANARPLDQRLFDFFFAGGSAEAVIDALWAYLNADGGFGNSLEPDFRLDVSSALATTIGFQYLSKVGAGAEHPVAQGGIRYFLDTYRAGLQRWEIVPPEVNDVPRAPWWNYDPKAAREPGFHANPGAEIVGYLHQYRSLVPGDFLSQATGLALERLDGQPDDLEMHDAACYVRMAERISGQDRERVVARLRRAAEAIVSRDPEQWKGYGATPLLFAPSPSSPLAVTFGDALDANLDFLVERQTEEGSWAPNWAWGQYEDVWPVAEREWRGVLTVDALKTLSDFGRIDRT